jgi:hypothetical protein
VERGFFLNFDIFRLTARGLIRFRRTSSSVRSCCISQGRCRQSLPVDHDHETGAIRGILCIDCNRALGMFRDDPRLLRKAAKYLENTAINRGKP